MRKVYAAFCKRTGTTTILEPRPLPNCLRNEFGMEQAKSHDDRPWKNVELRGSAGLDDGSW